MKLYDVPPEVAQITDLVLVKRPTILPKLIGYPIKENPITDYVVRETLSMVNLYCMDWLEMLDKNYTVTHNCHDFENFPRNDKNSYDTACIEFIGEP